MLYNIADHVSHCLFTINIVYYTAPVILVTASVLYPGFDTYAVSQYVHLQDIHYRVLEELFSSDPSLYLLTSLNRLILIS